MWYVLFCVLLSIFLLVFVLLLHQCTASEHPSKILGWTYVLAKGKQSSSCFRLDTRGKSLVGYGDKHYLKGICLNCHLRIVNGDYRLFVAMTSNFCRLGEIFMNWARYDSICFTPLRGLSFHQLSLSMCMENKLSIRRFWLSLFLRFIYIYWIALKK